MARFSEDLQRGDKWTHGAYAVAMAVAVTVVVASGVIVSVDVLVVDAWIVAVVVVLMGGIAHEQNVDRIAPATFVTLAHCAAC